MRQIWVKISFYKCPSVSMYIYPLLNVGGEKEAEPGGEMPKRFSHYNHSGLSYE